MILNCQRAVPVSLASLERFEQRLRRALRLPEDSLSICLVSASRMARWNRLYRSKRGPTDVLSFPATTNLRLGSPVGAGLKPAPTAAPGASRGARRASPLPGADAATVYLGDIAIAPVVARRNAKRLGRSLGCELRVLMLHGALHLLGYDHERDHGEMDGIERRLRRRLGLGGVRQAREGGDA